ncbi:CSLREA domain-containing protein [Tahibacter aquaticus]|uniref:CSLREA domain-containing protein n=1 Tax=Tahibacter aquaticus TaxID=520092 RepID=A0A4R6YN26_9GAMM|nr:CSLREA domain-containing protein [Tahibacter aquaticus]TDR38883.1 CSLREA domain-containing protein [Tahibacter aquaticus]
MTIDRVACLVLLFSAACGQAQAALLVTTQDDSVANDGQCSLREAISAANSNLASGSAAGECGRGQPPPFDRIDLPLGTYRLERTGTPEDGNVSGDLDVRRNGIEIVGAGADSTIVRGDRNERVFDIAAGLAAPAAGSAGVLLRGVTVRNGGDSSGGAVRTAPGWPLRIEACAIANNSAGFAGGIAAQGPLSIDASTFHGNSTTAAGGQGGGALYYSGSTTAQIRNTTFNANQSLTDGSAALFAGPARLNNVTAAGNTADADADDSGDGAIVAQAPVELANSLLAANIDFSLIVGGSNNPDCVGSSANLLSLGHNLIGNPASLCLLLAQAGDQIGSAAQPLNPRLLPLAPNGGPTETQMPAANSSAVDRGAATGAALPCESSDQRGVARPLGAACDIGAVESDDRIFANGFDAA